MLFGYPAPVEGDNWLHECLVAMLENVHASTAAGTAPTAWPDCIPDAHRPMLRSRTGIKSRLKTYAESFEILTAAERQQVVDCLSEQNDLVGLFSGETSCKALEELPEAIRASVEDIFEFAFEKLKDIGVRDQRYVAIYEALEEKDCPFCGLEPLDAPGAPREDLDHYLPRSIYPFAAANFNNLVPMGMKCNQRYKGAQNILFSDGGDRRKVFDPFATEGVQITLLQSTSFREAGGFPDWVVDFEPSVEEAETWNDIFEIRTRYKRDVLDNHYLKWLDNFAVYFRRKHGPARPSEDDLKVMVGDYVVSMKEQKMSSRDAMRVPVFETVQKWCEENDQRLMVFLGDLISGTVTLAA